MSSVDKFIITKVDGEDRAPISSGDIITLTENVSNMSQDQAYDQNAQGGMSGGKKRKTNKKKTGGKKRKTSKTEKKQRTIGGGLVKKVRKFVGV